MKIIINELNNDIIEKESINNYIINKIFRFTNKCNSLSNSDLNFDMIKEIFDKDYSEIYNLIIYLWIDIIHDNEDEDMINKYI